jgi:uncharacterized membrane protein
MSGFDAPPELTTLLTNSSPALETKQSFVTLQSEAFLFRNHARHIALATAVAVLLTTGASVAPAAAADPKDTKVKVTLSGALAGEGYTIGPKATLTTSRKYEETTMQVRVKRRDDSPTRTPLLTISLRKGKLICETARSWIWSTDEGSTVTLKCDDYISVTVAKKIKTGVVVASI